LLYMHVRVRRENANHHIIIICAFFVLLIPSLSCAFSIVSKQS
jgi:hypothetical protein